MTKTTLTLEDVESDDDECSVQCDLRNSEGKASSQAKIKILCPPKIICPLSYKEGLTYDEGDNLRLRVTFSGKPDPKVAWFFNGRKPFLDTRTEVTLQSQLLEVRIRELKHTDGGNYEFVAENEIGKDTLFVKVTVTGPPSPPSGFPSMELIGEDEVILKWNIPLEDGGSSVFNYIVEILKPENEKWERFATVHDTHLQITDKGIVEKSRFRVRAVNIYGTSDPGNECQLHNTIISEYDARCLHDTTSIKDEIQESEIRAVDTKENCQLLSDYIERETVAVSVNEAENNEMKHHLLYFGSEKQIDETALGTESTETSDVYYSDTEEETEEFLDLEDSFVLPFEENEDINKPVSVTELQESESSTPFKIMYVGTQTLISVPILNYACSDVYHFDELSYFAAEVMPLEEFLVQSIDHILTYMNCWFTTAIENVYPEEFIQIELTRVLKGSIEFHNCYLQNYLPAYYDCETEICNLRTIKDKACSVVSYGDIINASEKVCIDIFHSNFPCTENATSKIQSVYSEAIFICLHPWAVESASYFSPETVFNITESTIELYNYTSVSEEFILYSAMELYISDEMQRAASVTHIPEEFETLAGLKCVPMTSYKPALSVLPMSRTTELDKELRNKTFSDITTSLNESYNIFSRPSSDEELNISNTCNKCGSVTCLCSLLNNSSGNLNLVDDNNVMDSTKIYREVGKENGREKVISSDVICCNNIPDWLRYVSPFYLASSEERANVVSIDFNEKLSPKDLKIIQCQTPKSYLKDRSVQELLDLAEEVEKSFAQKAEHIESLENVLHEELNSLEKDLEAVHKIHQNLWNEDQLPCTDMSPCLRQDMKVFSDVKSTEKDLIDFHKDIPSVQSDQNRQDEYAPEVVTHLQNRVVQCGCRTRLYCSISGKPDPQIAWLKNGKLLSQSSRYVCSNLVEFGLYVDVFNAKSSDSGEYMCIATNCHGSAQTQAYLRVIGHREYSPEEPRFLSSPDDVTVAEGESVTLEWKITGTPVPHVLWFKNAEKVQTGLRIDALSNHRGCCRLVLHNLKIEDGAIYTCYLENEAGSSVSTVLVSVTDGQSQHCEESIGFDYTLYNLLSLPDDTDIPSLKYYERLLTRQCNPPLAGTSAKSKVKTQDRTKNVPGPPFAPYIFNSGKTWVVLSWSAPTDRIGNKDGLVYLVERRLLDGDHWREVGRTRSTLYTVSGLKSGQSYVFRISAGSNDGWGPPVMLTQPFHCVRDTKSKTGNSDQIY